MTSQALYRKWRSQTFDDLIGQEPIIRTLKNALKSGNLTHAYLFTGPRGTGKTSTARLLAKTVNCSNPKDGEPCNECLQCREITAGTSFNVIEIDAASNRGIENIRDLRERVTVPPVSGKYKVYVLDEAHMLTTEASNALLKTLEEPPPYAIFVLATTDVHKMLPTVLSRCQRFDFKRISTRQIVEHLAYVSEQEHIKLERAAAELIARTAAGGMRDALSLLDQSIAYAGEEISLAQVQAMLGVADPRAISRLITCIAELQSAAALHLIYELSEAGADLRQINSQLVEYWRALMLAKAGADVATILDLTEDEAREVKQLSQHFGLEELTECARIFAQNDLVQKNQGTPQLGLELASLACIEVHRLAQSGQPTSPVQQRPIVSQPTTQAETPGRLETRLPQPPAHVQSRQGSSGSTVSPVEEKENIAELQIQSDGSKPVLTVQQVSDAWESVIKRTRQKTSPAMLAMLRPCKILGIESRAGQTVVAVQFDKEGHYNYLKANERYKFLEWALTTEFQRPCFVRLIPPGPFHAPVPLPDSVSYSTSAAAASASQQSAYLEPPVALPSPTEGVQEAASFTRTDIVKENISVEQPQDTIEQKVLRDPVVQEVIKTFSARIVEVRPK
jgi:DNA polymerase-3 subunit gamma/tau